jgi:hypothetical protein
MCCRPRIDDRPERLVVVESSWFDRSGQQRLPDPWSDQQEPVPAGEGDLTVVEPRPGHGHPLIGLLRDRANCDDVGPSLGGTPASSIRAGSYPRGGE